MMTTTSDVSMPRVLLVEDDDELRELIARGLRARDFDVATAATGESAIRGVTDPPDAIVLDIGLPDSDGRDVCQAIRARGVDAPVIFLTARREVQDRLSGFAAGGDDYLVKPFALPELVARLRALVRRHVAAGSDAAGTGLRVDPMSHALHWGEQSADLSPIEFRLFARLLAEPAALVRRLDLQLAGWPPGSIVSDNTLDQYVTKLRRKLTGVGAPYVIRAVRGIGYQLRQVE